jgi:hypothetical protein
MTVEISHDDPVVLGSIQGVEVDKPVWWRVDAMDRNGLLFSQDKLHTYIFGVVLS